MPFVKISTKRYTVKNYFLFFVFITFVFSAWHCAKVGRLEGGPKDVTPPVYLESSPANYSTSFDGKEINITFDEFLNLESANRELLVSPPLEERPVVILKGKTITIDLKKVTLKENTTYTFNFGNAIHDLNENNPLPGFEFVVSTGEVLDSFATRGFLFRAFDLKPPEERVIVGLYENLTDSAPYLEIPSFIGRTNEKGYFSINNVKPGIYKIFALQDMNNNLLYDQPTESIAFEDTLVRLTKEFFDEHGVAFPGLLDTLKTDTLVGDTPDIPVVDTVQTIDSEGLNPAIADSIAIMDSIRMDSISRIPQYSIYTELFLFNENIKKQYLKEYTRDKPAWTRFVFNKPVSDTFGIQPLNFYPVGKWYYHESSPDRDTLDYWITDTSLIKKDTLTVALQYLMKDSANREYVHHDTLTLLKPKEKKPSRGGNGRGKKNVSVDRDKTGPGLNVSKGKSIDLNTNIRFTFDFPLDTIVRDSLFLFHQPDTIEIPVNFEVYVDSISRLNAYLSTTWEEESKYRLLVLPGAFVDLYGNQNDTLDIPFNTKPQRAYGRILLNISGIQEQTMVQLYQEDKKVSEKVITEDSQLVFGYLYPESYVIKVIIDEIPNGEWDTGNYLEKRQPEKVIYKEQQVNVRSNWDVEVDWNLEGKE
jgi:hypothetical protein